MWSVLAEPKTLAAVWFTVWQAALSTAISIALAIPAALIFYRRSFAGQKFWLALLTLPMVLPSIVVAIMFASHREFHQVYQQLGFGWFYENPHYWIVAAHIFFNFSLALRAIGSAWSSVELDIENAAELDGAGRFRVLLQISLPQLRTAIFSVAALVFLYCTTSFGIVLVLGDGLVHSIETEIATAALQFLDVEKAATLALLQTVISLIAFLVSTRFGSGQVSLESIDADQQRPKITSRDWAATWPTAIVAIALILVPMLGLLGRAFLVDGSLSLQNFINLLGRGERQLLNISVVAAAGNSLRNLLVASALALIIGFIAAYLLSRTGREADSPWLTRSLDFALLLPVGVSAVVLGLGYLITFSTPPIALRSSWLVLPLVQALMAVPLIIRVVYPALIGIDRQQLESAELDGASAWLRFSLIELGIVRQAVITAVAFTMIVSLGEFGAATLLTFGDQATLPTVLYQLISRPGGQNFGMAMATASLILLVSFSLIALAARKQSWRRSGAS